MLLKAVVSSFALLLSASAYEVKMYNKRAVDAVAQISKRATTELAPGISISSSAVGLTSTVTVDVSYVYNISIAGYVVAPSFDLEAADYGYSVTTEYTDAADLLDNLDKWQFIHVADDGLRTLITPDCSNTFTLLSADGTVLTWDICYSIGALSSEFSYLSTASATGSSATVSDVTVVSTGTVITSEESTTTETVLCPVCTGEPTTYFIFTATETVEGTSTLTVTVPCSTIVGYPATEPIGAEVYTHSTAVVNGATVTVTVPCGCAAGGTNAPILTTTNGNAYTVVPTEAEGTSTWYKTITEGVAAESAAATGTAEGSSSVPIENVLEGAGSSYSSSTKYSLLFSLAAVFSVTLLFL